MSRKIQLHFDQKSIIRTPEQAFLTYVCSFACRFTGSSFKCTQQTLAIWTLGLLSIRPTGRWLSRISGRLGIGFRGLSAKSHNLTAFGQLSNLIAFGQLIDMITFGQFTLSDHFRPAEQFDNFRPIRPTFAKFGQLKTRPTGHSTKSRTIGQLDTRMSLVERQNEPPTIP